MRHLISAMLLVVAIIHLLPLAGVLSTARLTGLYGISFDDPNLVILMRHRAVLFGVLGTLLAFAAFRRSLQPIAFLAGFVSVLSFVYLAWSVGGYNAHLGRVVTVDVIAFVCLAIGAAAFAFAPREV